MSDHEAKNNRFEEIAQALKQHQRFLVLSHVRPDGDAYGSQIAMALCLQQLGKEVQAWSEDGMLDRFSFLPKSEIVTVPPAGLGDFDVIVAVDTADKGRLAAPPAVLERCKLLVNIDHHISNCGYGDLNHIDPSSPATGQIIHELVRQCDLPMTYEMADNLFIAISTDTGSFQYSNTSARTFEIGAELIRAGVNVGKISQQIYDSYPLRRIELLREVLNIMKLTCDNRVASFSLTLDTVERLGVKPEDNEGLIDHLRAIDGVIAAVFFEELPEERVRISMRSKDPAVDACEICKSFGGGGHPLAAGARIKGPLKEVEERVLNAISERIHGNN